MVTRRKIKSSEKKLFPRKVYLRWEEPRNGDGYFVVETSLYDAAEFPSGVVGTYSLEKLSKVKFQLQITDSK